MGKTFGQFSDSLWDRGHIDKNLIKHNVKNRECKQVFYNRPLLVLDDAKNSVSERRWAAFGQTDADRLLVVMFPGRNGLIRMISARDMNRRERKFCDEQG